MDNIINNNWISEKYKFSKNSNINMNYGFYMHRMVLYKHYLIVFGGKKLDNDLLIYNIKKQIWGKIINLY